MRPMIIFLLLVLGCGLLYYFNPPAEPSQIAAIGSPSDLPIRPLKTPATTPVEALMHGNHPLARQMLLDGADPNSANQHGDTALIWATNTHDVELVTLLLSQKADPNLKGCYGKTALHWAAETNNPDLCQQLLKAGAQLDAVSLRGDTPLMSAIRSAQPNTVTFFVGQKAALGPSPGGKNPLALALDLGFSRLLLQPAVLELVPDMEMRLKKAKTEVIVNADQKPRLVIDEVAKLIHEKINEQRQKYNLNPLSYDTALESVAAGHSQDMFERAFFNHSNPDGEQPADRAKRAGVAIYKEMGTSYKLGLGENIYKSKIFKGSSTSFEGSRSLVTVEWLSMEDLAENTVQGWMNSQGHRANILNPIYESEGIGLHISRDGDFHATENLF